MVGGRHMVGDTWWVLCGGWVTRGGWVTCGGWVWHAVGGVGCGVVDMYGVS